MAEAERKPTPRTRKAAAGAPKASSEGKPTAKRAARRSGAVAGLDEAKAPAVPKAPHKPRVQGRKGGAQKVHTPVEAPDSVRSVARAKLLFALGEGEWAGNLDGRRIFLDGTPLIAVDGTENFPGVRWDFRPGTQHQEYIPGLPAVENETSVGVELRSDTPWVRSITNPELSAARVRLSWPTLQEQLSNGDVVGYRIDYAIDLAVNGEAWQEVLTATLNDKTTSKYERSHRIDLPESSEGWSLRVRRLTPNSQKNTVADTMRIEAITEVIDAKLRYPNTALLYIEFDSSQFQNIPKVSCEPDMRVIRVPSNYDPASRTYAGIWDGTFKWAFTDNPAWVLYDLILSKRFGLGRRLDMTKVDRWELYEIARYCDELVSDGKGGQEPRFTCNVYIQSRADAWTVIRDIAAIFRGISYWSGSEMVFQADKPSDVEYVFSRSNVIEGKFQYTGQSERTRYSSALVSWDNPDNAYESEPEPVSIPALIRRYNFNQTEITAIGCTRQSEAHRRGRWLLLTNSVDRGVTFTTGLEGYLPKPGRIIGVADALLAGRQLSGRLSSAGGRQLTIDRNAQIKAGDRIIVNLPSGKAEARTVQAFDGRTVTVTADFSEQPRAQAQWGIESADLVIQQYRVTKVSRSGSTFEISGVMNDPGKYDQVDSGTRLEPRPISVVPARSQQAPEGIKLSSYTRTEQGLAVTTLRAEWQAAPGAIAYSAEWRKDSGAWIAAPRSSALGFEVPGIYAGRYTVRVRAINPLEVASLPAYSAETTLNGKAGAPPALASFTASPLTFAIGLAWTFPAGADDTRYIEVQHNQQGKDDGAALLGMYPYPQRSYELTGLAPGVIKFFRARLVDTSGNVGPWTNWLAGRSSSDAGEYLELITEDIVKGALGQELFDRIDLIDGPPTKTGTVAQRLAAEAAERAKAIAAEAQTRTQQIDSEASARAQGLLAEAQARGAALTAEATARQDGDKALTQKIEVLTASTGDNAAAIQAEKTARTNADSAFAGQIESLAAGTAANTAAIGNEATARTNGDAALASQIATIRAESGGFDTALNYGFASTVEGWSGTRCSLAVENGRLIVTNTDISAYINSPIFSINGRDHDRIRCRITRRAGTGWSGQVTYVTANHASSSSYRKVIPNPGLAVGQSMVLEWDMSQLTFGDSDWSDSTVTRFHLWLSSVAGDAFEIDWIALGQVAPSASVASVVDERTARISGDEANASAITGLSSSLQTTNGNVTAAQQAAQAASDKAGGKGEVIYSSTEPATDKRLAQNLWIDTTGAANTPKRWTGAAWVAVTDKVAADAAAAAASALAQVAAKADASALQTLQAAVTNQGNTLTSQGTSITQLKASIGQQPDNLILRGSFEDGLTDPWTGDARITNISAHPSAGKGVSFYTNSFCGAAVNVVTAGGEQFDLSADIWPGYMTAGQIARFQMQFYDKAGTSLGYVNAFSVAAAATGFKSYAGRITAPVGAVSARFLTRTEPADGTGRSLWCNIVARRVTAADSANADAISTLGASVTQQGNTLTSQGQALTQLQSSVGGIGGSGANLLDSAYSWLTSATLPVTGGGLLTKTGVAVPEADSGFGYSLEADTDSLFSYIVLAPTNNPAGFNMRVEPGVYLVSMYVKGGTAGSMMANLYNGVTSRSVTLPYTTARTRITFPITITESGKVGLLIYPNRHAAPSASMVVDSIMVEKRIGESNTPSPFVAGPSAREVTAQATAISQMDTVVKQQGAAVTAQASRLDGLYVQVNPEMEGDASGLAGATGSLVGVWSEQSVRIEEGIATAKRLDAVQSQVGDVSAAVQFMSETVAGVDGRVSAISSWKTQTNANGRLVQTGIVQGSNGEVGEILMMAQRVAFIDGMDGNVVPGFVMENGQVVMNTALISKAFVQELVAGLTIKSEALNAQGLPLLEINFKAGTFILRGQDASGSTLLNNGGFYVYDANGVERTAIGRLS